jgi:hypothetical protein
MTLFRKLTRVGLGKAKVTQKLIDRLRHAAEGEPRSQRKPSPAPKRGGFVRPGYAALLAALSLSAVCSLAAEPADGE